MGKIRNFPAVTAVCVVLTLIFYTTFTQYVHPRLAAISGLAPVVGVLASTGFYLSVFQVLLWLYFRLLEDRINPKEAIVGDWFYKLEIRGKEDTPRFGICKVERNRGVLIVTGLHYDPSRAKFTSRFSSDLVAINDSDLIIMYSSSGVDEEIFLRRGVFYLTTEGVPPNRIFGVWTDALPSRNSGELIMQRQNKSTEAFLDKIGYPRGQSEVDKVFGPRLPPPAAGAAQ